MGTIGGTRRQIRRRVANMLDDFYLVSTVESVTPNSAKDSVVLAMETGFFKGMQGYVSFSANPDNIGSIVTVTASDGPNRTIYWEPALNESLLQGIEIELYNRKKQGATFAQYNEAINAAIRTLGEQHGMLPITSNTDTVFNRREPSFQIPENMNAVYGVSILNPTGTLSRIPAKYVTIDRDTATISISSLWAPRAHARFLHVHGYYIPSELQEDDETTQIEAEWLYPEIKANILERHMAAGIPIGTQDRLYIQERQQADGKRNIAITRYAPNTVRLHR